MVKKDLNIGTVIVKLDPINTTLKNYKYQKAMI